MKKLILLFLMLLLLIGGTGGSLKLLELGPFKPKKGEVSKNIFLKQKKDTTVFIDMDPLAIPIFQGNKVAATIQILVKLETNSEDNAEIIKDRMPVIIDAFVRDLHSFMPRLLKAKERVDVLIIKQRLQMIADKVAGKGLIQNVLVQSILDQPR
jgi:flagellar basal body-associated protein FliL